MLANSISVERAKPSITQTAIIQLASWKVFWPVEKTFYYHCAFMRGLFELGPRGIQEKSKMISQNIV